MRKHTVTDRGIFQLVALNSLAWLTPKLLTEFAFNTQKHHHPLHRHINFKYIDDQDQGIGAKDDGSEGQDRRTDPPEPISLSSGEGTRKAEDAG